jgi:hypothetical protein
MRSLATFSLVVLMIASLSPALASEAETIKAINESSNALDKAFEQNDKAAIKALMTPDHISVTPYYDGPQTADDQIASLPELKWDQKIVGDVKVSLLGDDGATANLHRRPQRQLQGQTFAGQSVRDRDSGEAQWQVDREILSGHHAETLSNRAKPVTVHARKLYGTTITNRRS